MDAGGKLSRCLVHRVAGWVVVVGYGSCRCCVGITMIEFHGGYFGIELLGDKGSKSMPEGVSAMHGDVGSLADGFYVGGQSAGIDMADTGLGVVDGGAWSGCQEDAVWGIGVSGFFEVGSEGAGGHK